jgi:predicted N-acetyltransferase YhbS
MRIRNGRLNEIGLLQQIEREAATRFASLGMPMVQPTSLSLLGERAQQGQVVVAEVDSYVAGFVMFAAVDGCAYIEEVDVLPACAGHRIGAALIDEVGTWASVRGLSALALSTFRDVAWNAPYYARLGFEVWGGREIGPGLAAISEEHAARGLDIWPRVFMWRLVGDGERERAG